jgi:AraC family transcriptional regulator
MAHRSRIEWTPLGGSRPLPFPFPDVGLASGDVWRGIRLEEARASGAGELPEGFTSGHVVAVSVGAPARAEMSFAGARAAPEQVVAAGHFVLLPAAMPFASRWRDGWTSIAVEITPEVLGDASLDPESDGCPRLRPVFNRPDPFVSHVVQALRDLAREGHPAGSSYGESLGMALAGHLSSRYSDAAEPPRELRGGLPARRMQRISDYVDSNLEREISLRDLAREAGMSVFHFARMFKQSNGFPPHQYILRRRIDRARSLLGRRELTIGDVAVRCGFAHPSHFSDSFHRLIGVTPTEYRRSIRS